MAQLSLGHRPRYSPPNPCTLTGYGAFSVSASNEKKVAEYIADQERHYRRMSFQEEFLKFLKKHGMEYDERYVWD